MAVEGDGDFETVHASAISDLWKFSFEFEQHGQDEQRPIIWGLDALGKILTQVVKNCICNSADSRYRAASG